MSKRDHKKTVRNTKKVLVDRSHKKKNIQSKKKTQPTRLGFLYKVITQRKKHLPELLICIGLVMMVVSATHSYLRNRALFLSKSVVSSYVQEEHRKPKPTHIYIQWFVDTNIEDQAITNNVWGISEHMASHLYNSANPGEQGNIIIYGHNTRNILGNIRALKGGERILITTEDGVIHPYDITLYKEVKPNDTSYLLPTNKETVTLYTCSGFMDAKRYIVQAVPANE